MCVFTLKEVVEFYKKHSSPVYVCFLDASKAYDRLNHWSLFHKLIRRKIPLLFIRLFVHWYAHQQFCIKWANITSDFFFTSNGVRQGGVASPILFNVYMDDLSVKLSNTDVGCLYEGVRINHMFYADDSSLLAPSPRALQHLINICSEYAAEHQILYNEKKTFCMCFKPRCYSKLYIPPIYLNTVQITFTESVKYLGVYICNSLSDASDMSRHARYLYAKGNILCRKFTYCSLDVKRRLFNTFCSNVYGGHLWCNFNKSDFNRVKVAFNKIYRVLFGLKRAESISQSMLFNNMCNFRVCMRKLYFRFRDRLYKSKNILISTIVRSSFFVLHSSTSCLWRKELF